MSKRNITPREAVPAVLVLCLLPILPLWVGLTVAAPPLGVAVLVVLVLLIHRDRRLARRAREAAEAEHKQIWGF